MSKWAGLAIVFVACFLMNLMLINAGDDGSIAILISITVFMLWFIRDRESEDG